MRIDVKKTELQNVLDHVNEINEWDIQDKDIRKIIPYVRFPLPEFYVEAQAGQHDWNGRNTYLELAPAALKYRWSRESQVYYRRIHIGLQLDVYLKDRAARGETGKITVWYDVDKNPFPTTEEFETAMNLLGPWRFESIETNVIDVVDKGYEYPIEGTLDARANNSLIYIGRYLLPVLMMPKPPIPDVLDGFALPVDTMPPLMNIFDGNRYGFGLNPVGYASPFPASVGGFLSYY